MRARGSNQVLVRKWKIFFFFFFFLFFSNFARTQKCSHFEFTVRCTHCNEEHSKHVVADAGNLTAIPGSRGEAHIVVKCRSCERVSSIEVQWMCMRMDLCYRIVCFFSLFVPHFFLFLFVNFLLACRGCSQGRAHRRRQDGRLDSNCSFRMPWIGACGMQFVQMRAVLCRNA